MKFLIAFTALIVATNALSVHQQWTEFKGNFSKQYKLQEEKVRFHIFQSNLRKIAEHNAKYEKGEVSYYLKVTNFADWTEDEFNHMLKAQVSDVPDLGEFEIFEANSSFEIPTSIDWRQRHAVLAVKDQGLCGSCWAFSVTGTLEGQLAIHRNLYSPLSNQELVDCDTVNAGCNGGDMRYALMFVQENGIVSEVNYPYRGVEGTCRRNSHRILNTISSIYAVHPNEYSLASAVGSVGPISIGLNANSNWQLYGGGIFDHVSCTPELNHGVLAVGYDSHAWIIKNSWGTSWGENGYIRLVRGKEQCGVSLYSSFATL